MWRFHPQTDELVRLVRAGAVGERARRARGVRLRRHRRHRERARCRPALEGGALMDVGCYCVSALRLLCGEPMRVSGEQVLGGDGGIDIRFAGVLRFAGDVLGTFDCGMDVHRRHSIEVVGSEGTILVPSPWQTPLGAEILLTRDGRAERIVPETVDPYARELDEVGAAIAERRAAAARPRRVARPGARDRGALPRRLGASVELQRAGGVDDHAGRPGAEASSSPAIRATAKPLAAST